MRDDDIQLHELKQTITQQFNFTGSGKEYFRIWIVNLCLTIATFGIYSAWAKVRRQQYFDRNTSLAGSVFNFHGNPIAVLKGRLIALVLLFAYHYAFGFSKTFGIVVIVLIFVGMPWLIRSALRFRLRNTSYRGLRFNFNGTIAGAYLSYAPLLLVLVFPACFAALFPDKPIWLASCLGALYLCWPLIHGRMKVYQHSHLQYGDQNSTYSGSSISLLKSYSIAAALGLVLVLLFVILSGTGTTIWVASHKGAEVQSRITDFILFAFFGLLYTYIAYLLLGPYLQVRIWNLVWNRTRFPGLSIQSTLRVLPYARLQAVNVILTLLTLGLFRPFAVVRLYRYRLAHLSVTCDSLDDFLQHHQAEKISANGDGAADFLGIDLSW